MIRTSYDPDADAFYVRFGPADAEIAETREVGPGVILDLDGEGAVMGIEVLAVRQRQAAASTRHAAE
jgi:uncharacterized protein YuzE